LTKSYKLLSLGAQTLVRRNFDQQQIQVERDSIQRCLDTCAEISLHIEKGQPTTSQNMLASPGEYGDRIDLRSTAASARRATITVLGDCRERIAYTSSQFMIHLRDVLRRLDTFQGRAFVHPDFNEQSRMQEEINSIKQSLAVCAKLPKTHPRIEPICLTKYRLARMVTKSSCQQLGI
jgi:hypothetical protein